MIEWLLFGIMFQLLIIVGALMRIALAIERSNQ